MITTYNKWLRLKFSCVALLSVFLGNVCLAASWQLGKQIYETGRLPNGRLLDATIQGDIRVKGDLINCASCHRRSGYGDGEGGSYVPPITGAVLFSDYAAQRQHLFRNLYQDFQRPSTRAQVHDRKTRSQYDVTSLRRALNQGLDSDGKQLSSQMPRFDFNNDEIAHLSSYLEKLGTDSTLSLQAKGVDSDTIHFATIYAPDAEFKKISAVQAVFDAYLQRRNLNTLAAQKKPGYSAGYKSDFVYAQRKWKLHQWQLSGEPETWPKQLEERYAKQPVFAVLGGIADEWHPMHAFCEKKMLPCLFPNTPLPYLSETGLYSLYITRGLYGEAEALSKWLGEQNGVKSITQIYRRDTLGQRAEQFFSKEWRETHNDIPLTSIDIANGQPGFTLLAEIDDKDPSEVIVLWLGEDDLGKLATLPQKKIIASASLLNLRNNANSRRPAVENIQLIWPWALPSAEPTRLYRARAWMRSRNVPLTHEVEQLNTFFTLNLADYAIHDLIDRFSREYFIEIVERNTENTLNPGLYKHMSLGPEQRVAVRAYSFIYLNSKE